MLQPHLDMLHSNVFAMALPKRAAFNSSVHQNSGLRNGVEVANLLPRLQACGTRLLAAA